MGWEAWLTLGVAGLLLVSLAFRLAATDLLAVACLGVLIVAQNVTGTSQLPSAQDAAGGFGNEGLITVGLLFAVVAGLELTGGTELATFWLLKRARTLTGARLLLLAPVSMLSAFLNNTPVVAAMLPVVNDLSKRVRTSSSQLLLPLSYATILGGTCTLIGTSTNLLVQGLVINQGMEPLGFFAPAAVGLPLTIAGLAYILLTSRWLLPSRRPAVSAKDDPRQYTAEMTVSPGGALVGQTIEQAGLRHLPGLYLAEIQREEEVISTVGPAERLRASDLLILVGALESVVDLQKIRGLTPASDQARKLDSPAWQRKLVEAVVSSRCSVLGKTIREGRFRTNYGAAVIAVARGEKRLPGKLGDVRLEVGDVLLLEASQSFLDKRSQSHEFFLVSPVPGGSVRRPEKAWLSMFVLVAMVLAATLTSISIMTAALMAALAMIALRCCTTNEARNSIDWSVLIVIGAAIGIGRAMDLSGAAKAIADSMLAFAGDNPFWSLAAVFLATMLCTEMITNNAAAVLMFEIGWQAADGLGCSPLPFIIAVMIAASASFSTPFGYQTNMMEGRTSPSSRHRRRCRRR
ncbi:MAG: SLC13 family permease [Planctomycetaceae bacterium]